MAPFLSIVIPVRNEANNIAPLVEEIEKVFEDSASFEIIYVDDGSTDQTREILEALAHTRPHFSFVSHLTSCGQSASIRTGVRKAKGPLIATLDGDGQNDPAFLPRMVQILEKEGEACGLVQGERVGRQSSAFKRFQSRSANVVRGRLLGDSTRDTGCGLKCFWRHAYFALPYFDALHRFMPALMKREGYHIAHLDIVDRPRHTGQSNYGFWDRLWVGIVDLIGVYWLMRRRKHIPTFRED